jgi:molybdopterin converting factor small subunit
MRNIYNAKEILFEFDDERVTVKAIIDRLLDMDVSGERGARQVLVDHAARPWSVTPETINPALVILVNDVDVKLRGGIDAELVDGDAITFLPTIHGG